MKKTCKENPQLLKNLSESIDDRRKSHNYTNQNQQIGSTRSLD